MYVCTMLSEVSTGWSVTCASNITELVYSCTPLILLNLPNIILTVCSYISQNSFQGYVKYLRILPKTYVFTFQNPKKIKVTFVLKNFQNHNIPYLNFLAFHSVINFPLCIAHAAHTINLIDTVLALDAHTLYCTISKQPLWYCEQLPWNLNHEVIRYSIRLWGKFTSHMK